MKTLFIFISITLVALAFGGCASPGPDYTPIGDGLKAIAIGLVAFGVVGALADLIRHEQKPPEPPPSAAPRKSSGSNPKPK